MLPSQPAPSHGSGQPAAPPAAPPAAARRAEAETLPSAAPPRAEPVPETRALPSGCEGSGEPAESGTIPPVGGPLQQQAPETRTWVSGPAAEPEELAPGAVTVPGYEVLGELGRGGMGVVYKARHLALNRLVALKMILAGGHAGTEERRRFVTEAEAVARLQHPNIVQIYEIGESEGRPFFSLEFCPGGSLARKLNGTPLPAGEAARLVAILARAMHAAHEAGVVHRDLKPANVLLTEDGTPKVTDFGLAKKLDDAAGQTATGAIMGTPSYMSPEQAAGKGKAVGPAADVYALGAMLYELLTGRPPFKAATAWDTLLQVATEEPVPPSRLQSKVPRDLETVCLKCLDKEPGKRYASAGEVAEELERCRRGEPIRARRVGLAERTVKWIRRRPAQAAVLAASQLLILGVGALAGHSTWRLIRAVTAGRVAQASVTHTDAVLATLDGLLARLEDLENGQRGYLLTGDAKYLEPYTKARHAIDSALDGVTQITSANALQQRRLRELRPKVREKMRILEEGIALKREKAGEPIQEGLKPKLDAGELVMDDIRRRVAAMQETERDLLRQRTAQADDLVAKANVAARTTFYGIGLGVCLAMLLMSVVGVFLVRSTGSGVTGG